jgi:hypothetical protein
VAERRGALAVLLVVAVAVVALAARTDHRGGEALRPSPDAIGTGKAILLILVALVLVTVAVLVLWGLKPDDLAFEPRERSWRQLVIGLALMFLVLLALAFARRGDDDAGRHRPSRPVASPGARVGEEDASPTSSAPVQWGFGIVGVVLLLGAAGAVAYLRRPAPMPERAPRVAPIATPEERDDAVATALACPDPRQAVLLAFAAAEAVLSRDPATRRPPATSAREWASAVQSPPLTTIVGRYEIARFSQHAVVEDDRRIALDALRSLPVSV